MNRRNFMLTSAATLGTYLITQRGTAATNSEIHVCPKSRPPARTIYVMRLGELTTDAWDLRLTLCCLQGIVNRSQPRLYYIHDHYDELWLDWLHERGDVDDIRWLNVSQVFERFLPEVKVAYIIDPAVPASINVATMLASIHQGLVITPRTASQYNLPMGRLPDSWKTGMDLRFMSWKKDVEAYRWAYQKLGNELSQQAIAILDPKEVALRDYLVEFKIPILWIAGPQDVENNPTASPQEEVEFAREILLRWPPNIPCLGWPGSGGDPPGGIGEWLGVRLLSKCAKFEVCSAYDGFSPTVGNVSVHSGTTARLQQTIPPVKLRRDKVYFAFVRSDGDGWNFQRHYYRKLFDEESKHGSAPIGWQIGPSAIDGQPDILDYYYKHASVENCFVNALSGVGYIHEAVYADNYPQEQREKIWQEFVRLSGIYRARIDASVMSTFAEMSRARLALLAGIPGIKGIFANYGRTHATIAANLDTIVNGVPAFRAENDGPSVGLTFTPYAQRRAVSSMINRVKFWAPKERPAFLHVFLANWLTDMSMVGEIAAGLGSDYVAVRPDQLVQLFWQSRRS